MKRREGPTAYAPDNCEASAGEYVIYSDFLFLLP